MSNSLSVDIQPNVFPTVRQLVMAKKAALRRGIWFRALNRVERGVIDLTERYVDRIKSSKLAYVVTAILEKLKLATESAVDRLVRTVGLPLAQKISLIAQKLGNLSAQSWASDTSFACFLAIMNTNRLPLQS
jgi:hypothetical protein